MGKRHTAEQRMATLRNEDAKFTNSRLFCAFVFPFRNAARMWFAFLLLATTSFVAVDALADESADPQEDEWKFLYKREGIAVYEAENETRGIPKFKAEGVLDLNVFEIMAVLTDLERRPEWVQGLEEIRVLEGDPRDRAVVYNKFDLPWPASDRESIVEAVGTANYDALTVLIRFETVARDKPVPLPGVVRIPYSAGSTRLKYLAGDKTAVVCEIQLDPGGKIPKWIARLLVEDSPIRTIKALRTQVLKTRGQYEEFIRLHRRRAQDALEKQGN